MASQVAERYGQALFELARETKQIERWQVESRLMKEVIESSPELSAFFRAVKISTKEKKELVARVFEGKIDPMLLNFLMLLIDKKRVSHTSEILSFFNELANDERGILNGVVYSARKLSPKEIREIEEAMTKRNNQATELVNRIDPDLISGVKVVIGNEVIDGSMRSKIDTLRNELLKESR